MKFSQLTFVIVTPQNMFKAIRTLLLLNVRRTIHMVKRRRLFYGGGCQNPHHLESMGKYLQWNATFFFTGSSALAKIVGPQEEDLHPWKRSHWSTPGSDSSDIHEGMVEDDEPHLDSSLDMTWQCVDDLDNAKRLVVVHQFLDLWFFFLPCKLQIWSFCTMEAVWSAGGDNDFVRSICKLVLRPHLCWSFAANKCSGISMRSQKALKCFW